MNLPESSVSSGAPLIVAPYVMLYLVPAVIAAELALYGWYWRRIQAAIPFILLMTAVVFWSACHALSVASSTFAATLVWAQVQYGGIVLIGPIWLVFALAYCGTSPRIAALDRGWLLIPAGLSYAAVLTNGWHHLWWPTVALDTTRPFASLSITRGLLFWLHFGYSYGCVLLGFALIIHRMFTASPLQRRQARIVAIGASVPLLGNLAHVAGLRTTIVDDPTPFLFAASGLLIFYAALRYQFPDRLPVPAQTVFASLPDGLAVLDQRGIVTALNDTLPRVLELAAEGRSWVGQAFQRIIAGSPLEVNLRALLAPPATAASLLVAYTRDLSVRGVELRLRPLYMDNAHAGALLVVRDRTERARNELLIERRVNELTVFNRLARALNGTRTLDDLALALARELLQVMPGERVLLGLLQPGRPALRALVDEQVHPAPDPDSTRATEQDVALLDSILNLARAQVIDASDPRLNETAVGGMLQHYRLRTVVAVPLTGEAGPLGALLIGHADDRAITPGELELFTSLGEVAAEAIARVQRGDASSELSQDASAVLANVTHELRTPLTSIIGFTDMLGRGIFGELPELVHEPLAHMRRNSQTLLRLVNDILNYSKIEAENFAIELGPVDLPSVIHDVAGAMQPQIQERGLELRVEVAADLPQVYANRDRLDQVLTNLIANAIKFTEHGSITVRASMAGERACFSVTDTGIGIAPAKLSAIFQAFQQIENQYQERYPGTGLGLAISRRLMELMGGTLTVESTPGEGSTFIGEVPVVPASLREKEHGSTL